MAAFPICAASTRSIVLAITADGLRAAVCVPELRCGDLRNRDRLISGEASLILMAADDRGGEAARQSDHVRRGSLHRNVAAGGADGDLADGPARCRQLVVAGEACSPACVESLVGGPAQ